MLPTIALELLYWISLLLSWDRLEVWSAYKIKFLNFIVVPSWYRMRQYRTYSSAPSWYDCMRAELLLFVHLVCWIASRRFIFAVVMNIYFILVHIVPITLMEVIVVLLALHILVKIRDDGLLGLKTDKMQSRTRSWIPLFLMLILLLALFCSLTKQTITVK